MEAISFELLNALPYGVILLEGGVPRWRNAAARRQLPLWGDDAPLPPPLEPVLDALLHAGSGTASCTLDGRAYEFTLSQAHASGQLLSLVPLPEESQVSVNTLTSQLRQYLGDLHLSAQMLAPRVKAQKDPDSDRYLSVLNQSFYRLLRLTRHMELSDQLDSREDWGALDLVDLCAELTDEADLLTELAGVTLEYDSKLLTLPTAGSRRLLRVMLLNLISNAVKAAGKDGHVWLRLSKSGNRAILTVEDTGHEPADLSGLFPLGTPTVAPGRGLGLGLSLVRRIALLHGGALLAAQSEQGMKVTLSLPLAGLEDANQLRAAKRDPDSGFSSVLVELSDALPAQAFDHYQVE